MAISNQELLLKRLAETHGNLRSLVKGVDLETRVYSDGWRIRDILGHIAAWDRQVTLALQAFTQGDEYLIPEFDEQMFNEADVKGQSYLSGEQIFQDWVSARKAFKKAVREVPLELFSVEFLFPWGDERGTVEKLVNEMCKHDETHYAEVETAIKDAP